jgi:hypothetical protein
VNNFSECTAAMAEWYCPWPLFWWQGIVVSFMRLAVELSKEIKV